MKVLFSYFQQLTLSGECQKNAVFTITGGQQPKQSPYETRRLFNNLLESEEFEVDNSLLVVNVDGRCCYYGDKCLEDLVLQGGFPRITHTLTI